MFESLSIRRASAAALVALSSFGCAGDDATSTESASSSSGSAAGEGGASTSGQGGSSTTANSTAGTGGGASSGGAGGAPSTTAASTSSSGGGSPADACLGQVASCPGAPPTSAGKGLVAVDRCAFPMADQGTWTANADIIATLAAALPSTDVAGLLGDLNRTAVNVSAAAIPGAVPNIVRGFRWNDGDNAVAYWIPQGITGSADRDATGLVGGHHVVLVAWYYEKANEPASTYEKGVRLAFVDTSLNPPKYRFALLVEPVAGLPPSFKSVPIHAGGIAWVGEHLYVADTSKGFRVFDLAHILSVDASKDMIGHDGATNGYGGAKYAYVVPQLGRYVHASSCGPRFSFVGLDRTVEPPSLVSGEYCSASNNCDAALSGRLYRWPIDPATGRLGADTSFPSEAYYMGEVQVQGALFHQGTALLSSSAPASAGGELYVIPPNQPRTKLGWIDSPEDLYQNLVTSELWGLSENEGARYVVAAKQP